MKKFMCAIISAVLLLALAACGSAGVTNSYPLPAQETTPVQETAPAQETAPGQETTPAQETTPTTDPTMEIPTPDLTVPSEVVIPNPKLGYSSTTKMSDGLMMIFEEQGQTKLYGYMNYRGEVVIPAQYSGAEDFFNGCAIVRRPNYTNGAGVINTKGEVIVPLEYRSVINNGNYLIADTMESCDLYSLSGEYCGTLPATTLAISNAPKLRYAENCPLFAVQDGNKWALATETGVITEAVYDSIWPMESSSFAVLKVGDMSALAGPNGIIYKLSANREYPNAVGDYVLVHEYDYSANPKVDKWAILDITGNTSEFVSFQLDYYTLRMENGIVSAYHSNYWECIIYDITTGQTYTDGRLAYTKDGFAYGSHVELSDGRCLLLDGTWCRSVEQQDVINTRDTYRRSYCIYQDANGKYGLCFGGVQYTNAIYDSPEEVWENYGYYKEEKIGGKPAIVYGNESKGFTPVIQFGNNDLPYDEIIYLGEDYYACRFNETWYLVHS